MYLKSLQVRHLKRARKIDLDFTEGGKPRMWTVFIGENGTAKTSLLHGIALAAAGSRQVNSLAKPVVAHLRDRRGEDPLSVRADFVFSEASCQEPDCHGLVVDAAKLRGLGLRSNLSLASGSTTIHGKAHYIGSQGAKIETNGTDPLDNAREFHTPRWFVAAYGVSRALPDAAHTPSLERRSIDRLEPLFHHSVSLASTSFANHFQRRDADRGLKGGETSRLYAKILNDAIQLGGEDLLPDIRKIELRGQGGTKSSRDLIESDRFHQRMGGETQKMAGVALSHGYQSTFAWIADLIGHALLESEGKLATTDMEGLVLLDEIDLYLHPRWQATFITGLRRVFPRIQFIATSHSPVVLAELRPSEIVRLIADGESGDVCEGPAAADPRPMTGSEVYRQWFDIDRLTPNPLGAQLREYLVLAGDPLRTGEDEFRLEELTKQLNDGGIRDLVTPVRTESSE